MKQFMHTAIFMAFGRQKLNRNISAGTLSRLLLSIRQFRKTDKYDTNEGISMILSVSRRTDIPACYADWFYNRIKEGYMYVRNPVNPRQVSRIILSPQVVDCIVFWTKNPAGMMQRLDELEKYRYCFQFTVTGYGRDIEPGVGDKKEEILPLFRQLSKETGSECMTWLYDPVFVTPKYTMDYHVHAFEEIASCLCGYTDKVIVSFLTMYRKTERNMKDAEVKILTSDEMIRLAASFRRIADRYGMRIQSCAEKVDLSPAGVCQGACIDRKQLEKITGVSLTGEKDRNQRERCMCFSSIDAGAYNTCLNGCRYCYANYSKSTVIEKSSRYDPYSPILCDSIYPDDRISERKVFSLAEKQISLF